MVKSGLPFLYAVHADSPTCIFSGQLSYRMPVRLLFIIILLSFSRVIQAQSPGQRVDPELFYHAELKKILLIDGQLPFLQKDTIYNIWTWNGQRWQPIACKQAPPPRYASCAVYDRAHNAIISFSGRSGPDEKIINDTWVWKGGQWAQHVDAHMPARDHHTMCYDESTQETILFGGGRYPRTEGPWATDTWVWKDEHWLQATTEGPPGRVAPMVYDAATQAILLFGGVGAPTNGYQPKYGDTWQWQHRKWTKLAESGPPPRARHAMAYDKKNKRVLLYGGENDEGPLGDLWQWDGRTWTEIIMPEPNPGDRYVHVMAYDEEREMVVLYGGMHQKQLVTDTWEWNGTIWRKVAQ